MDYERWKDMNSVDVGREIIAELEEQAPHYRTDYGTLDTQQIRVLGMFVQDQHHEGVEFTWEELKRFAILLSYDV